MLIYPGVIMFSGAERGVDEMVREEEEGDD
jgi:hypothetical protein